VFRKAEPIVGGREFYEDDRLEEGAIASYRNNFQGRYIIRHLWADRISCRNPIRGVWGGPDGSGAPKSSVATSPNTSGDEVFLSVDDVDLERLILSGNITFPSSGCGGCATVDADSSWPQGLLVALGLLGLWGIRRRK
jgi:MYXO-CTERM domain-containing protein